MKKPFHHLFRVAYHLFPFLFFGFVCFSSANAQTIVTAAGTVTWSVSSNITEVTLNRSGTNHTDGFDGAMNISVTGTNITYTSSYHFSSTYGAGIQNIAITNTGGTPSTFNLVSSGNLGSDGSTRWHYSSNSGPRYTISSDNVSPAANGSDPVISLIYGNAALNSFTTSMTFTNSSDAAQFTMSNVPISAGQTRRFLILVGVGNIDDNVSNMPDQALLAVQGLSTGTWPADFTNFLTAIEKGQVMNWSSLTTLPVVWVDFTARSYNGNDVKLQWTTASELNAKDFIVEHSTDGSTWYGINTINASGNTNVETTYSFIHNQPSQGVNYYRLKQNDIDNKISYSKTVKIIIDNISESWKLYQNPVANGVLEMQLKQDATVSLYNGDGRLVLRKQLATGYQQLSVNSLPAGMYYLEANGLTKAIAIQ